MTEIENKPVKRKSHFLSRVILLFFIISSIFISYKVFMISKVISGLRISDDKMEYVYEKVNDLVNILNTKDSTAVNYNPTEKYDFKPADNNEIVSDKAAVTESQTNQILKQQLSKMNDTDKLKTVRDKLVDIYQESKERDDELAKLKQSFYETKSSVEAWYNDKKNIKAPAPKEEGANQGIVDKLKKNLNNYIQISKVEENLNNEKKILDIDQIPEMLSYAEILMEAGSFSQAAWILEDIESVTKQPEILTFTTKVETYVEKYPNPNIEVQQVKELIELIEDK